MTKTPDADDSRSRRFKIGYIASHIYRHTFEINEVVELLRQRPDTRVYSFYGRQSQMQTGRVSEITAEIVSWSCGSIIGGLFFIATRRPVGFVRAALQLAWYSLPNPVYWVKNLAVFWIAMPILADALRHRVVHLHANFGSSPATVAWLGKKVLGAEMSITFHAFDIYLRSLTNRDPLKRRKLLDADLVVAAHHDGAEELKRLVPPEHRGKFAVIRICVEFRHKEKLKIRPQPPLLLAAGNLVPMKGFDVLVGAVGALKQRGVLVRARILGEGSARKQLESLVRENGLSDRVELPGYFQHATLADHLAEASIFVMPSIVTPEGKRDGIPTVVVEAWLSHTPVVASLVGGMAEVIIDGTTGLVFPSGDGEALATQIVRLLNDDGLWNKLSDEGYRTAVEWFSPERNVSHLLDRIEQRRTGVGSST
jgi:glycosyltransferase involved in cell wall biosynthesis